MVSAEDKFFNSNGVRIRYIEQGTGEPVVLVHGYTGVVERAWIKTGVLPNLAAAPCTTPRVQFHTGRVHEKSKRVLR
jgi:hypothetical protein